MRRPLPAKSAALARESGPFARTAALWASARPAATFPPPSGHRSRSPPGSSSRRRPGRSRRGERATNACRAPQPLVRRSRGRFRRARRGGGRTRPPAADDCSVVTSRPDVIALDAAVGAPTPTSTFRRHSACPIRRSSCNTSASRPTCATRSVSASRSDPLFNRNAGAIRAASVGRIGAPRPRAGAGAHRAGSRGHPRGARESRAARGPLSGELVPKAIWSGRGPVRVRTGRRLASRASRRERNANDLLLAAAARGVPRRRAADYHAARLAAPSVEVMKEPFSPSSSRPRSGVAAVSRPRPPTLPLPGWRAT